MNGLFARPASGASIAIATFWALVFLTDGLMRLLPADDSWLIRALGTDIVPQTARIFSGLGWPLGKVRMIVPFAGAWEIAIAMFLIGALYEQMTHDSDDLVPGSAMLILGLSMAVTTVAIVLVAAVLARETAPVLAALWWPTALLLASLVAAIAERLHAEEHPDWQAVPEVAAPLEPFHRR
ncbi:MAG: hypothetical protein JNK84_00145 [Phreatobacter sp.]|uniref:hypothetical protein n=1 Tax=Phreatobacter sp. TaxID=1966341 RepID=UPI001A58DEDD|nr:hypothetical protein [Phreatobacter sp.]MBL8567471.1 hypothetical protein [Phreatobacter sp.]